MLSKSCFNSSGETRKRGKRATSNPGMESPVERSRGTLDPQTKSSTFTQVDRSVNREPKTFRRNMSIKDIKIEFFILEDNPNFQIMTDKEKMLRLMSEASTDLKQWYYERGIEDRLPSTWKDFKEEIIEWCQGNDWTSIRRYRDEQWSSYVRRLKEKIGDRNEENVYNKLEQEKIPRDIKLLILSNTGSVDDLINKIESLENYDINELNELRITKESSNKERYSNQNMKRTSKRIEMPRLRCYECKEIGHKRRYCPKLLKNEPSENSKKAFIIKEQKTDDSAKEIQINGFKYMAIFDTGSDSNFIHETILKDMNLYKKIKRTNNVEIYKMLNNTEIKIENEIYLKINFEKKEMEDSFKIIRKGYKGIIIGNELIRKLEKKIKNIPIECEFKTEPGKIVSWSRPIRNRQDKKEFIDLVEDLERRGIVEPSRSLWLNPIVLQRKKNGTLRFCVDFRKLNDIIELDGYEIPKIQEIISTLRDYKYFSVIDLKDGFFQINIKPEDREKTTFYTGERLMQFRKMPQGYKNSPGVFQRAMTVVLEGLIGPVCQVYIDDILIYGRTREEHRKNFKKVIERLTGYGLIENEEKRVYEQEEVEFLGYKISLNKIKPTIERAQGIMDYRRPKTKKEVQRFLGKINYDRRFIKDISLIAKPLYELTEKDKKFVWEEKHEKCFNEIKNKWKDELELIIPDESGNFELETDASATGIGAVLRQNDNPVAYISKNLTKEERNYGITEREFLAALWAMEKFQYYLSGKEFTLITDHKAIEAVKSKSEFGSPRIQRWMNRLNQFNFKVKYIKGCELVQADALSRSTRLEIPEREEELSISEQKILKIHEQYNHRKTIREKISELGIEITSKRLKEILEHCIVCRKKDADRSKGGKFIVTSRPGEIVAVDLMQINEKEKVILAIDYFSRKLYGAVVLTKESKKICEFLRKLSNEIKIQKLRTDSGKEFNNELVTNWSLENQIEHELVTPYYHKGNGRIERANRTIRDALRKSRGLLRVNLEKVIERYNETIHRGIGMTPNNALKEENWELIIKHQEKYKKEFKERKFIEFNVGDHVLVKNELKHDKMDDEYRDEAIVKEKLDHKAYKVLLMDGSMLIRHCSQLRRLRDGDVVLNALSSSNRRDE